MNRFLYRWMYWLGQSHWDTGETPPEVVDAIRVADYPDGPALDLGCGTGTSVVYLAKQGKLAIGVDFVPTAIARARIKAQAANVADRTQFIVGDVTRLNELHLPQCSFALDMGCFHGLSPEGQLRYAAGLSAQLMPGGKFLLYALKPRREMGVGFGMSAEKVQAVFAPAFEFQHIASGDLWDKGSTWYWMKRKANSSPGF